MGKPRGAFINYHAATIVAELSGIPQPDLKQLFFSLSRYAAGDAAGFTVKDYGDGLKMLKKSGISGRCLFSHDDQTGPRPVILLAYKKESDEAPQHLLDTARERRGKFIEARKRNGL